MRCLYFEKILSAFSYVKICFACLDQIQKILIFVHTHSRQKRTTPKLGIAPYAETSAVVQKLSARKTTGIAKHTGIDAAAQKNQSSALGTYLKILLRSLTRAQILSNKFLPPHPYDYVSRKLNYTIFLVSLPAFLHRTPLLSSLPPLGLSPAAPLDFDLFLAHPRAV